MSLSFIFVALFRFISPSERAILLSRYFGVAGASSNEALRTIVAHFGLNEDNVIK